MYVIIAGAGVVGLHIASVLAEAKHEVTVIEPSEEVVESIRNNLDVKTIVGNASTPRILREAEVSRTDLLIAFTNNDETNILVCFLARELGAKMTVARVRNPEYTGYFVQAVKSPSAPRKVVRPKSLGVDLFINPEVAVADELIDSLCGICSVPVSNFADGRIQIVEFGVEQKKTVDKPLKSLRLPPSTSVATVIRNGKMLSPEDDIVLEKGDRLFLVAVSETISELENLFSMPQPPVRNVVIFGGGHIGRLVAEGLEKQGVSIKIIESDPNRGQELASQLNRSEVVLGDATDRDFLIEQGIPAADAFVAAAENNELNILCALLAKSLGVPRSLISLTKSSYIPLAKTIGVDVAVSPLTLTAGKIIQFVLHGGAIASAFIGGEELQAIEFVVSSTSGVADRRLSEAVFPNNVTPIAVVRSGRVVIPPKNDILHTGDHVIVLCPLSATPEAERFFK